MIEGELKKRCDALDADTLEAMIDDILDDAKKEFPDGNNPIYHNILDSEGHWTLKDALFARDSRIWFLKWFGET